MNSKTLVGLLFATLANAIARFQCTQLVFDRLDPLVAPGATPSRHIHQIVGGNRFSSTMDPKGKFVDSASCTTCQFSEDFSNYWTAIMYFKARNGTYKRVPQMTNFGFEGGNGGMTVYYMQDPIADMKQKSKVTSFKPGFRMLVGDPEARTRAQAPKTGPLTYTCLETMYTRAPMIKEFPKQPCKAGVMTQLFFPTCWDGKNLDSPDHKSHMAFPAGGTFGMAMSANVSCPASHPVKVPELMLETLWDTRQFNDKSLWPTDGSQPFIWSYGDKTGYGNHADYVFGWKGDSLQKLVDTPCYMNCPGTKQSISKMNKCSIKSVVNDPLDGWLPSIPGAVKV